MGLDVCRCVSQGLLCVPLSPSELQPHGGRFESLLIVVIGKLHSFENHQNIKTSFFWRVQPFVFRSVYTTSCFKYTHKIFTCWGCFPLHFWSNLWPRTFMVSSPRRRRNRLQKPRSQKWLHRLRRRRLQKPRSQKWLQFVASEISIFPTELPWIAHWLHHFYPFFWQQIVGLLRSGDSSVISTRVRSVQGLSNLEFCAVLDGNSHGKLPWTEVCQASFCWNMAQLCSQEEGGQSQT